MSIHDLLNKIKDKINIDKGSIIYSIILILVAMSSFGLGRVSSSQPIKFDNKESIKEPLYLTDIINNTEISKEAGKYVASKNGKKYYTLGCSGAKRIKTENQIWFNSKEEAEKSGYTFSVTCK